MMTAAARGPSGSVRSPWIVVGRGAALFAVCVGIGRFVFTPILPLMVSQVGLTREGAAVIATANYAGYLVGALVGFAVPGLIRSRAVTRLCLVILVLSLALMPVSADSTGWVALRFVAGTTTAIIFMFTVDSTLAHLSNHPRHLRGWAFGGVGAGIVLSGMVTLIIGAFAPWQFAWWAAAILALGLSVLGWTMPTPPKPSPTDVARPPAIARRWFFALLASYSLEGVGYIIAGTFLVATVAEGLPAPIAGSVWIVVGFAALPSAVLWTVLGSRWSLSTLLVAALVAQAIGIALFPLLGGVPAALAGAVLFGATFVGVSTVALSIGVQLRFPRSVALLTAGYSLGQIVGPLVVSPLLPGGYRDVLLVGSAIVVAAAIAAALLRSGGRRPERLRARSENATTTQQGPTSSLASGPRSEKKKGR